MPWKCPACSSEIVHPQNVAPTAGLVYRCAVCHQELVYDPLFNKMRPSPVPPNDKTAHIKDVA